MLFVTFIDFSHDLTNPMQLTLFFYSCHTNSQNKVYILFAETISVSFFFNNFSSLENALVLQPLLHLFYLFDFNII